MTTVPTFLVGHMSGENWDPAWRAGRDLYRDVWMVARQAWFAGEMARRFGAHPAVCGWLVSNEMPIYGGEDRPRETISAWAQLIISAVRAAGATQPVSLGDGGLGAEVTGDRQRLLGGRHRARCATSSARTSTRWATTRSASTTRPPGPANWPAPSARPVVLEEFGVSSDFASDEQRRALLPAGAAQHPAGRCDRLGGLEQHRLRQPGRAGPVPPSHLRAALRADRLAAARPKPQLARDGRVRRDTGPRSTSRRCTRADSRHRPGRAVLPGHALPVHPAGRPYHLRGSLRPGLRRRPAGRPASRR